MKKTILATAVCSVMFNGFAHAEHNDTEIEKINIWGTQVKSTSVYLGNQDIATKQADHLSDLLRDIPGVDVGGTHALNQRINIRGLQDQFLDIRLDGASQKASVFHHFGNILLNPDILKSADITVGNNSVLINGINGGARFETKDGRDMLRGDQRFGSRINVSYGHNDIRTGSVTAYGELTNSIDALVYRTQVERGNHQDGAGNEVLGYNGEADNTLAKVGFQFSEQHRLNLSYDQYNDKGLYSLRPNLSSEANLALTKDTLAPTEYERDTFTLNYKGDFGHTNLEVTYFHNTLGLTRDETNTGIYRNTIVSGETVNSGVNVLAESRINTDAVNTTFRYGLERLNQEITFNFPTDIKEDLTDTGLFVEADFEFANGLAITPGLRHTKVNRDAITGSQDFSRTSWALAADYQVSNGVSVFASYRALYEAPPLTEMFTETKGRATLEEGTKATDGSNRELGFNFATSNVFGKDFLNTRFTVYKTDIDNRLATRYTRGANWTAIIYNESDLDLDGFEFSTSYQIEEFSAQLGFARNDSMKAFLDGSDPQPLAHDLGDKLSLTLQNYFIDGQVKLSYQILHIFEEENVPYFGDEGVPKSEIVKPAYTVQNISAQYIPANFDDNVVITLGVDNLFDENYASHASYIGSTKWNRRGVDYDYSFTDYEPGRNIKLSAAYSF